MYIYIYIHIYTCMSTTFCGFMSLVSSVPYVCVYVRVCACVSFRAKGHSLYALNCSSWCARVCLFEIWRWMGG